MPSSPLRPAASTFKSKALNDKNLTGVILSYHWESNLQSINQVWLSLG
jgi:hypothetical protein